MRERKRGGGWVCRERQRNIDVRERYIDQLPQPRYVSSLAIELAAFWYTGWYSNQVSYTGQGCKVRFWICVNIVPSNNLLLSSFIFHYPCLNQSLYWRFHSTALLTLRFLLYSLVGILLQKKLWLFWHSYLCYYIEKIFHLIHYTVHSHLYSF